MNVPRVVTEVPGPRSRDLVAQETRHLAPGIQSFATLAGIAVARAEGCFIEDVDGNRFLDLAAGVGVNALGHAHPRYRQALKDQIDQVTVGSFTTERRARALSRIVAHTPDGLDKVQLYSSGAEAVEAALRLAKSHTKKYEFLSFWGGFHGKTAGALSLIGDGTKNELGPLMPGSHQAPYADCYRCPLKLEYPSCGIACADWARQVVQRSTTGALAAVVIEPVQGTAGNVVPPPEFLRAVADIARENQALLIDDEMITGFGRTGRWFGCEESGVVPDIMTIGKGLGSGFPVAGLVSTERITTAKPWGNPSGSSSSYGGNPLAAAAVDASLEVIEDEGLVENSAAVGAFILDRLRALQERYEFIGCVRGRGLLIGVELVRDRTSREPLARDACRRLFQECARRGLLCMIYSPHFRINPPLLIDRAAAEAAVAILDEAMATLAREGGWR